MSSTPSFRNCCHPCDQVFEKKKKKIKERLNIGMFTKWMNCASDKGEELIIDNTAMQSIQCLRVVNSLLYIKGRCSRFHMRDYIC